jgi:AraC-like DNA-binding protein
VKARDGHATWESEIPALRATTREELGRRLHVARDFILDAYAQPLTVQSIAAAACLSPFYCHRLYRSAFGRTPMEELRERRLDAARELLRTGNRSVADVCAAVGLESLGSFSSAFRRRFGVTPGAARRLARVRRRNSQA